MFLYDSILLSLGSIIGTITTIKRGQDFSCPFLMLRGGLESLFGGSAQAEQRLEQILAVPNGTKAKMRNAVYCEACKISPPVDTIKEVITVVITSFICYSFILGILSKILFSCFDFISFALSLISSHFLLFVLYILLNTSQIYSPLTIFV